jgi:glycosyltransferase involved in cell wall biosynthesis
MNSAALIADALQSLAGQTFRDFEVIVSDGASPDGTATMAARFASLLPALRIDSRPDTGVYDAINRGVRLSSGEWFLVLGSDDRIHTAQTLAAVASSLSAEREAPFVYGDVRMMADSRFGGSAHGRYAGPRSLEQLCASNICQQSIFYRRSLFDTLGGFDLRYRICSDWDFNLRASFIGPGRWIDLVVADYAATGMSAHGADDAFMDDLPGLIRAELLRHPENRALWPLQRRLLREGDALRRRGEWGRFLACVGTYLGLLFKRIPLLLRRA